MIDNEVRGDDTSVRRKIESEVQCDEQANSKEEAVMAAAEADVMRMNAAAKIERKGRRQEARVKRTDSFIKTIFEAIKTIFEAMRDKNRRRVLLIFVLALVLAVVLFVTVVFPLITHKSEPEYFTSSTLEKVVKVSQLSTVECIYNGIAKKEPTFFGPIQTDSGYSVKYSSRVKVSYDFSAVRVEKNDEGLVVYLPEPKIGDPVLDDELGFIPEGYSGDFGEALSLCKDDVVREVQQESSILELANENMERTITSLMVPLVGKDTEIKFSSLSEYPTEANNEE